MRSLSPIVFASDISDICVHFQHFRPTSVILTFQSFYCRLCSLFNLIHSAWPILASQWWPHRINCIAIHYEKCLPSERQVLSPDSKKSEGAESFETNCQLCLFLLKTLCPFDFSRPWIWERKIFFFHWQVDKRKRDTERWNGGIEWLKITQKSLVILKKERRNGGRSSHFLSRIRNCKPRLRIRGGVGEEKQTALK